jgi:hypothetical protein
VIESMEFGHGDEQLLLGLRSTYNINGRNRTFNDIAVMDVWNTATQEYRNGSTQRVLPSFPPSESSHPMWAQTRSSMIAFDHVDEVGNPYVVIADIHSGAVSYIPVSSTPALPTFSGSDSLVSYVHMDGEIPIVTNQPLMPDGMTPTGNPVGFIFFATQPRWLRIGRRPVAVRDVHRASDFVLRQNYPNPFNPETTLRFSLERTANIQLRVTDNLGRTVRLLVTGRYEAGLHSVPWDGRDDLGRVLPSGSYHAVLSAGDRTATRTMLLLK